MTTLDTSRSTATRTRSPLILPIGVLAAAAAVVGWVLPDRTVGTGAMDGMSMTHYMGLLAVNQPWNLILFMAIPVILAETLAITELVLLFRADPPAWVHSLSRWAGLLAGPLMVLVLVHLVKNAVVPLSSGGGWRGPADVIAVISYLLAGLPLIGIALVEVGLVGRDARDARKWHAMFVGAFLVLAHVAMIFGMLDPAVLGWGASHVMPGGGTMPGMNH
jgi:hypothetical protein